MLESVLPLKAALPGRRTPAVTIVIPTYNRVEWLGATLDSVAAQTFTDFEVVVVDDGSTDGTREYIASRPERILYAWQPNQGVAEARNHGLRVLHSEFVAFLDSDDLWEPAFLEEAVGQLCRQPNLALVFSRFTSMDVAGRILVSHNKRPFGGDVTQELFNSTFIHTSAVVARAHAIRDAGGFDSRLSHNEDYDLWLRLSLRHEFGLIPKPLCIRRCHPNSLAHNGCTPDVLLRKATLLQRFYEHGGGKPKIGAEVANDRLAHVYYTAGKALCRAGRHGDARDALRRSLEFSRSSLRAWFWYIRAGLRP
jgi:glycosyltransferase involved in cell wall biosynthesis